MSIGKVIGKTLPLINPATTYMGHRKEGKGLASSVGRAAFDLAKWEFAAPLMTGLMVKDMVVGGATAANTMARNSAKTMSNAYSASFGGNYQDSENAYTMRQRGVQAIQNNGMNARSVLGSEARQYFRGGV